MRNITKLERNLSMNKEVRKGKMVAMRRQGYTYREVAEEFGITTERARQILKGLVNPEEAAAARKKNLVQRGVVSERHGMSKTKTYRCWANMHNRCRNPNHPEYRLYGGRGIKVCKRWTWFTNFLIDMGEQPKGMLLDREDNDGNYEPGNCRWATPKESAWNSRRKFITPDMKRKIKRLRKRGVSVAEIAERLFISQTSVRRVLKS